MAILLLILHDRIRHNIMLHWSCGQMSLACLRIHSFSHTYIYIYIRNSNYHLKVTIVGLSTQVRSLDNLFQHVLVCNLYVKCKSFSFIFTLLVLHEENIYIYIYICYKIIIKQMKICQSIQFSLLTFFFLGWCNKACTAAKNRRICHYFQLSYKRVENNNHIK